MSFDDAFSVTMGNEGGYSKDPNDPGGETYRGISRRFFPSWPGWPFIDKSGPDVKGLDPLVKAFYKQEFWDRLNGDALPADIGKELFDSAVNCGVSIAAKWLQRALNLLNRGGKDYPEVVEDGKLGPGSMRSLQSLIAMEGTGVLFKVLNIIQGGHYLEIMRKSPSQEKWARGWLKRVSL